MDLFLFPKNRKTPPKKWLFFFGIPQQNTTVIYTGSSSGPFPLSRSWGSLWVTSYGEKTTRRSLPMVIQSDLFGMVKWPFWGVAGDLQLGDKKPYQEDSETTLGIRSTNWNHFCMMMQIHVLFLKSLVWVMMSLKEIPEGALFWAAVEKIRVFFRHNKKGVELYTIITVQLYTCFVIQNFASTFEVCFQVFFCQIRVAFQKRYTQTITWDWFIVTIHLYI